MSWFIDNLTIPAVGWMQELEKKTDLETVKRCIANSGVIREMLAVGYKSVKSEIALEDMPKEEKLKLWEESKICVDRHGWCKAVRFWEKVR